MILFLLSSHLIEGGMNFSLPFLFFFQGAALKYLPAIVNDVKLVFDPKELR